jgi:hypothetical protein
MKHNGNIFRIIFTLGFRMARTGDLDLHGKQMDEHHVAIVHLKDCRRYTDDKGRKLYDPDVPEAKCIPMNHGGTYYGYGKRKIIKSKYPKSIQFADWTIEIVSEWEENKCYLVNDGHVYTSISRHKIK